MPIRNFRKQDLPALVDFVDTCHAWQGEGSTLGKESFRQLLGQPGLEPDQNLFILESDEGLVQGFCLVISELPIGRSVLEFETATGLAGASCGIQR